MENFEENREQVNGTENAEIPENRNENPGDLPGNEEAVAQESATAGVEAPAEQPYEAPAEETVYNEPAVEAPAEPQPENQEEYGQAAENEPSSGGEAPPVNHSVYMPRVEYTKQAPITDYSPFSRGLKVFCAILAAVILLTGATVTGYFFGKNNRAVSYYNNDVKLDLSAKPKSGEGMTAAQVYEAVNPSVVGIRVYNSSKAFDASGIIYTEDGYIITNDHIYSQTGAPKFKVYSFDGKEYDAEYVAGDSVSDLAVLKIKGSGSFKAATFGNSAELVCGENVFAVGRPKSASDSASITAGTVSLTKRRVKTTTNYASSFIQTDSAINPGSSGGALSNMYGQVVGVTSSKLEGSEYDRIGFAIPTVTVKRVVDQLISNGKVTDRAKIGITYNEINSVTKEMGNYSSTGLLIQTVNSDSDLYGKASKNDIITHINGVKITSDNVILDVIEAAKAGDEVTLTVLSSAGAQNEYKVKLGANVGESSYSATEKVIEDPSDDSSSSGSDGTFNFPFGE